MLECHGATLAFFKKNHAIAMQWDETPPVGIIVEGNARVQLEDSNGRAHLLEELSPCDMFGIVTLLTNVKKMPASVWAVTDTTIIYIDYNRIINICPSNCDFHRKLLRNMFEEVLGNLFSKTKKISILKSYTTREKLMAFLDAEMEKAGSCKFVIVFNRSKLAEYLGLNRSSMSRELCKMRDEGLLEFNRNHFHILYGGCKH